MQSKSGMIKVEVASRPDGTPLMLLTAADKEGRDMLSHMEAELEKARFLAVAGGKADIGNVCGSFRIKEDEPERLEVPLALGGVDFKLNSRIV